MPAVNTVPPWAAAAGQAGEDADLPPDIPSPTLPPPARPRPHRHPQPAASGSSSTAVPSSPNHITLVDSARHRAPPCAIPRTASPELEDGLDPNADPPLPAPAAGARWDTRGGGGGGAAAADPSLSQALPRASGGPHHVRIGLHRLRRRLSEYHATDDTDAVSEDYDPSFEDISDDEIHEPRPPLRGRRARGMSYASDARRIERSRSLDQSRFTWDKDEWLTATLRMSPAERRRLGHEIRNALANSGSYWAKRRQRRKLRQQMRNGGGASDPNDSFQPMNLAVEAAHTFGARAFTGHDPPKFKPPRNAGLVQPIQHPDAPWPPPHHQPVSPETPYSPGRPSHPLVEMSRRSADTSQAHLVRMSGLNLELSGDSDRDHELHHDGFSEKDVYTRRQASDDRWNTPWQPQIARTDTGWSTSDSRGFGLPWLRHRWHGGEDETGFGYGYGQKKKSRARLTSWSWWRGFLLHNPFAPLFVRTINLVITTCTLAVAIRERQSLRAEGVEGIVGVSPLLGIIFAPLTLAHIFFQVWLEYFGRPIGLWSVRSKLLGTSIEIIFVGMWSAEMALAWDNYFTTPSHDIPHPRRGYIRRLQCFLIGLSFISLFAYMITLTLSLFRIFVRVSAVGGSGTEGN